jgi:hypothetical protein
VVLQRWTGAPAAPFIPATADDVAHVGEKSKKR